MKTYLNNLFTPLNNLLTHLLEALKLGHENDRRETVDESGHNCLWNEFHQASKLEDSEKDLQKRRRGEGERERGREGGSVSHHTAPHSTTQHHTGRLPPSFSLLTCMMPTTHITKNRYSVRLSSAFGRGERGGGGGTVKTVKKVRR